MSAIDNLPPDQRAVLQMVLVRGRSYDEIANMLSIDPGAVRRRALDALEGLTPATVIPGPERGLVTDYLLGQLPEMVAEQVYSFLQASDSDREWAQAVARELALLASASLPEIPVGAPLGADDWASGGLEEDSDPPDPVPAAPTEGEATGEFAPVPVLPPAVQDRPAPATPGSRPLTASSHPPAIGEPRRSSRRGGAILLGTAGALIVAAIVVVIVTSGGGRKAPHRPDQTGSLTTAQTHSTTTATGTTTTSTTGTPAILAQLNLRSPAGGSSTLGVVQVIRQNGVVAIAIDAQGMPANSSHNAYAVWLYNSASSFRFVGWVDYLVGKNGKLVTGGDLKPGAAAYHHLLITLETTSKPHAPGQVVLSGPFREHP